MATHALINVRVPIYAARNRRGFKMKNVSAAIDMDSTKFATLPDVIETYNLAYGRGFEDGKRAAYAEAAGMLEKIKAGALPQEGGVQQ